MKWLLDTNLVSESVRPKPSPRVLDWMSRQTPDQLAISAVTVAEIAEGASSAPAGKRHELMEWLDATLLPSLNVLPLTNEILIDWIRISRKLAAQRAARRGVDLLIAATARTHELILVTRNVRDFADTGVAVYDPWSGKTHQMEEP